MRKRKKRKLPGLLVTHCHTENSKKRSIRVLPSDELLKSDASVPSIQKWTRLSISLSRSLKEGGGKARNPGGFYHRNTSEKCVSGHSERFYFIGSFIFR